MPPSAVPNVPGQYANWYMDFEKRMKDSLRVASNDVTRRLRTAEGLQGNKLRNARAAIRAVMSDINTEQYALLKEGRLDAARLAARIVGEMEAPVLAAAFTDSSISAYLMSEAARVASGLDMALARMRGDVYVPLSQQVYKTGALSNGIVDRILTNAFIQGQSAAQIAAAVRSSINPDVPGGVSYAAMRLGRTELNNAFHASAVSRMSEQPWVEGVTWNLSDSHEGEDECDDLATADNGLGEGVYPQDEVPDKPHPQCLCFVTAELPTPDQFIEAMLSGRYDDYIAKVELEQDPVTMSQQGG